MKTYSIIKIFIQYHSKKYQNLALILIIQEIDFLFFLFKHEKFHHCIKAYYNFYYQ